MRLTRNLQVNRMTIVEQLLDWKADGIISDCKKPSLRSYEAGLITVCLQTPATSAA